MLFCNVPFSNDNNNSNINQSTTSTSTNLARIFQILNQKKEERLIETYALTQTTLEQIFVQLAGEDEDLCNDQQQQQTAIPTNNNTRGRLLSLHKLVFIPMTNRLLRFI